MCFLLLHFHLHIAKLTWHSYFDCPKKYYDLDIRATSRLKRILLFFFENLKEFWKCKKMKITIFLGFCVYYTSAFTLNYGGTYSLKQILSSLLSTSKETFGEGRDLTNNVLEDASLTTVSVKFHNLKTHFASLTLVW